MRMYDRRLQILLDEERYRRLSVHAAERNLSIAAVIREAIDAGLPASQRGRKAAVSDLLGAAPMPVPKPAALLAELDELRGRHG